MALIEPYMIKSGLDLDADEVLELEAKSGESLLVKDVVVHGSDDSYVLLEIDKTTVGFFRVTSAYGGSHLYPSHAYIGDVGSFSGLVGARYQTLISYMIQKGWMRGYPVAEGQKFRVKPFTSGKKLKNVYIVYEKYDAGDIKATDQNGSEASEYVFISYGQPSSNLTNAGDYLLNTPITPKEFPNFPFGVEVPSKTTIEVLGILGTEVANYVDASKYTFTKYLKMFKGRTCLFDRDKHGLIFYYPVTTGLGAGTHRGKGISVIGNYSSRDRRPPFEPPVPLVFTSGDEVNVYVTAGQGDNSGSIESAYVEIGFIERVKVAE